MSIFGRARNPDEDIYFRSGWEDRRILENGWYEWYSGRKIVDATDGTRDPETREYTKLYPLGPNPVAKV